MLFHWIFLPTLLSFGFYSSIVIAAIARNIEEENGPLVISESVQGTLGRLPCNITPPVPEDRVALVIWYKEGLPKPIYSFDRRNKQFENGSHWVDEDILNKRAYFLIGSNPATLTIKGTKNDDSGTYRCRVDFQKSPTRNSKVQLKVIIPPENLVLLDDSGSHVPHYILGPYNEGASINITCVSSGGRPLPNVTWWHENTLLDDTSMALSDRRVSNVLELVKLKRKHLHMQLTCQASNNNLTTPISSTVTLDMNLRPLFVKLQGENRPLSADNSYELSCDVIGSRPPPTITWWKGSTPMKNTHEISNPDGNKTTSILTFTPTIDDRGKFLSCRAEQTLIPESGMEDGWKLDIYHIPVVSLELGTNINTTFREGIDVYFECNIKSNPWIYKVSWRHNGNPLEYNQPEGIIVSNQSLVLQNVSRARSGIYTCVGSNREGDGESNPVQLDIRFAPVCRPGQRTAYSSGRQETVKVICEVEANPTDVQFLWKFNSSATETVDIAASLVAIDRSRSIAHYTPMTEHDYGTLLCWANNEIGDQSEPCVYHITPAGEPDSLINCTLLNQTSTGFQIECIEGFDGGLEQDFIMEVYVNGTTRNPKILKSKSPYFEVRGLVPGVGYNVFLIAHNSKGRSNATILQVYTLKDPEKQTDLSLAYAPVIEDIRPFLGILLGIVGSIFLVALIIVIVVRMRGSSGRDRNNYSHQVSRDTLHNGGQSVQDIRIGRDTMQTSSADSIDKNPDIIPHDERDEDDEWTTKGHNRAYATAALAEQNAVVVTTSTYDRIPYAIIDKKVQNHLQQQQQQQQQLHQNHHQQQQQQQQQQAVHHHHHTTPPPQYITTYNTLIPVSSKMGYNTAQQNKTDLTYAELATPVQRIPTYCSATLGRPRQNDIKRAEPNIYSQIDLAHHPMYSTSSMYGTNTITGVTMSHPPQLATFPPPPPIFAHKPSIINPTKCTSSSSSTVTQQSLSVNPTAIVSSNGNGIIGSGVNGGGGSLGTIIGIGLVSSSQANITQQQQQQQQRTQGVGGSGGLLGLHHPVVVVSGSGNSGTGTAVCYTETANSIPSNILKTVPEENSQMNGDDTINNKSKDRNVNHATRF